MFRCSGLFLLFFLAQAAFAQDTIVRQSAVVGELSNTTVMGTARPVLIDSSSLEYKVSTVRRIPLHWLRLYLDGDFRQNQHPDTNLTQIQNYNPLTRSTAAFQDLGFHGSPSKSLNFDGRIKAGFNIGTSFMEPYFLNPDDFYLYQAHNSYTSVQYTQGANQLLWLKLTHAQNLKPNFNLGVDFQRLKHDGYYLRTAPSIFNTRIFGHYYGKKYGRYHMVGSAVFNRADIQESGGFRTDSLFEEVEVPVNITLASARNKVANTVFNLTQYYRFGKKGFTTVVKDSLTLETDTFNRFYPRWQLFHNVRYEANRYTYSSRFRDTLLYKDFFIDSFFSLDSIHHRTFRTEQGIAFSEDEGKFRNSFWASFLYETHRVFQKNDTLYEYHNSALKLEWKSLWIMGNSYIDNRLQASWFSSGYNQGDYQLELKQWMAQNSYNGKYKPGKLKPLFFIQEFAQRYAQPFIFSHLRSNHFIWNKSLDKTDVLGLQGGIRWQNDIKGHHLIQVKWQSVNNYTYLDTAVEVQQLSSRLNVLQLSAEFTLRLGNFHLYNQIIYQSDNNELLRLPAVASKHSWYYEKNLKFRNPGKTTGRMLFQGGFDIYYRSEWRADAWNPAARNFHLQDQILIGNYPQIDAWLAAKVKTVDLYLKLEHANQSLMGARYYSTPHYALYPRSFRFGLLWRFF